MDQHRGLIRTNGEKSVEVHLPNMLGYERVAMECCASFARIAGFTSDRIEDLKTAVSEACLNAIEHGNKLRPEARVTVTLEIEDDCISVRVKDEGDGIKELPEEPDIVQKIERLQSPRRLGIFLIRNLVDHVEFNEPTNDGHVLKMVLRQPKPSLGVLGG